MSPERESLSPLSTSAFPKRIDALDAFQLLRTCWRDARPVVPLFGAGISVESGIPLIDPIESYLKRLTWAYDRKLLPAARDNKIPLHEYLLAHGWPSRQDVHQLLTQQRTSVGFGHSCGTMTTEDIETQALASLQLPTKPKEAKWWEVFDAITHSHAGLKDRFFDDLVRNRRPATTHQHAAFLAKAMNWRLILTTNFDELLEQSLSQQQLSFSVYALPESGSLPHPSLIRSNRSLIKMHGSAFALLTGAILDEPLEFRRWNDFLDCFHPDSLILVLGYAGSDKRVTTLLRRFCADPRKTKHSTRVLWVCRSRPPLNVDGVEGISWLQYRDAGAFLQELHNQLISSHPASPTSYVALPQFPPAPRNSPVATTQANTQPVIAFTRRHGEFGTSSALISFASRFRGDVIWCHLERIPNVDALIAHLQTELRRQDPGLPPFALFRTNSSATAPHMHFEASDPRVDHLLEALQRSKYLIAMDSVGEFGERLSMQHRFNLARGRRHPDEHKRFRDLLCALANRHRELGESTIAIASPRLQKKEDTAPDNITLPPDGQDSPLSLMWVDVGEEALKTALPIHFVTTDYICVDEIQQLVTADGQAQLIEHYHQIDDFTGRYADKTPATFVKEAVRIFWNSLVTDDDHRTYRHKLLLLLSCVFRRSRGIVGLRRLVIPTWKTLEMLLPSNGGTVDLKTLWSAVAKVGSDVWCAKTDSKDRRELDQILRCLNSCGLLVHQEGGHWWMHRVVREALTELVAQSADWRASPHKIETAKLNDTIAVYYFERIFLPSKDPTAFVEYLFHRTRSLEYGSDEDLLHRLEDLNAVLWRSRDHLLSQSQADTLIAWTEELADDVVEDICTNDGHAALNPFQRVRRELRATLCDLGAEGRRQKCDYFGCLILRLRQVRDRLLNNEQMHDSFKALSGEWDQLASELDRVVSTQSRPVDRAAAGLVLKEVIRKAGELLPVALRALCVQPNNASDRSIRAALEGFRLAEHLIDISVCTAELGYDRATWKEARANALDLLTQLSGVVADILRNGLWPTVETVLRRHALRVLIRIGFREMEIRLSAYSLWLPVCIPPCEQVTLDPRINGCYEATMRCLGEFHGLEDRDALHYRCFISALRGRAAYLSSDYSLAYQLLETASSVITPHQSGSEASALAICHLFRAECLIKDADHDLERALAAAMGSPNDSAIVSDLFRVEARARSYLERASIELAHAMRLLHSGRPHVKWWTRLYLLQAQLEHEWLAMVFLEREFVCVSLPQDLRMRVLGHVTRGVRSLRLGIDCARQDWGARIQLAILHKQFYLWTEFGEAILKTCLGPAIDLQQLSEWRTDVIKCSLKPLDEDESETASQFDSVAADIQIFATSVAAKVHEQCSACISQGERYDGVINQHRIRQQFLLTEGELVGHSL